MPGSDSNKLHLYPINDNEFIGVIKVDARNTAAVIQTVVVIDSSVGRNDTPRFVRHILPTAFNKLGYDDDSPIHVISYARDLIYRQLTVAQLRASDISYRSGHRMAPAIGKLRSILEKMNRDSLRKPIRILIISYGIITDNLAAENETKKLVEFLATTDLMINLQTVRMFNKNEKAFFYLSQINNTTVNKFFEFNDKTSYRIVEGIVDLFRSDRFQEHRTLEFKESIILRFPWNSTPSTRIMLAPDRNIFWLKQIPTNALVLGANRVKVVPQDRLTLAMFHELMQDELDYIVDHVSILKIVDTTESNSTVDQIFSYFERVEENLAMKSSKSNTKIITNLLDEIVKKGPNFSYQLQMEETLRCIKKEIESECRKEKSAEELRKREEKRERRKRQEEKRRQRDEPEVNIKLQSLLEEGKLTQTKEKEIFPSIQNKLDAGESSNGLQHVNEKQEAVKKNDSHQRRSKVSLITTATNKFLQFADVITRTRRDCGINPSAIETVIMVDENVSGQRKSCRFTEKILPLVFSKLSNENLHTPHTLTIYSDTKPVVEMLRPLLQTFDANKRIRILILTLVKQNEECDVVVRFARTLIQFLNETSFVYELQVVRLAAESRQSVLGIDNGTTNYQLNDIDAKKSNTFIALRIVELCKSDTFQTYEQAESSVSKQNSDKKAQSTAIASLDVDAKRTSDLHTSTCEFCRDNIRKYHYSYYGIFLMIFAIPITLLLFDIYSCYKHPPTK